MDECASHVFALVPYFSRQSPVCHLYLCLAVGTLTSLGVAVSGCMSSSISVVAFVLDCACKFAPMSAGDVVEVGFAVLVAAFVFAPLALGYLCAIGIWVHKRSWSESLYDCYGKY